MNVDLDTADIAYLDEVMAARQAKLRTHLRSAVADRDQERVNEVGREGRRVESIRARLAAGLLRRV